MKIRYAKESDKDWLKNSLLNDGNARVRLGIKGSNESSIVKFDDQWEASFIAEENDIQMGIVTVSYDASNNLAYLNDIYIPKGLRRKGIAKELIEFAINYALDSWGGFGIYAFTLGNKKMENLFQKLGFENNGVYKKSTQRGNKWISQTYWLKEY